MRRLVVIPVVLLLFFVSGCEQRDSHASLKVGMPVWPGYEPMNLAYEKGLYGDNDFVFSILGTTSETKNAFRNGVVDVAALTMDEVLHLAQDIKDIRVFLITDISNGGDAIVGQPDIDSLESLKGRTLGMEPNALSSYLLARAVKEKGKIALEDIVINPIGAAEHKKAFLEHRIDAVVTYEPLKSFLIEQGGKVLFDSSDIPNEIIDVLIVRESVAKMKEKELKALVYGWFEALKYMKREPRKALEIMARSEGVDPESYEKILEGMLFPGLLENRRFVQNKGELLDASVQKVYSFMVSKRILAKPVAFDELFTDAYLPPKAKL